MDFYALSFSDYSYALNSPATFLSSLLFPKLLSLLMPSFSPSLCPFSLTPLPQQRHAAHAQVSVPGEPSCTLVSPVLPEHLVVARATSPHPCADTYLEVSSVRKRDKLMQWSDMYWSKVFYVGSDL